MCASTARRAPRTGGESLPLALLRCPYGRGKLISIGMARPLAERGFQVLMQSTRGTFGSGGAFDPFRHERQDGLATLEWVVKQPWFGDSIVLAGPSYLGYVQWAVADCLPPEVKAIIPNVTEAALTLEFLRQDGFSLETPSAGASWSTARSGAAACFASSRRAAGVPVRFTEYVGMPHGYLNFPGLCRSAPQALAELCAEQRAALVEPAAAVPGPAG